MKEAEERNRSETPIIRFFFPSHFHPNIFIELIIHSIFTSCVELATRKNELLGVGKKAMRCCLPVVNTDELTSEERTV